MQSNWQACKKNSHHSLPSKTRTSHTHTHTHTHTHMHTFPLFYVRVYVCTFFFFSFFFFFFLFLITFVRSNRNTSYQTTEWFPIHLELRWLLRSFPREKPRILAHFPRAFSTEKCWSSFAKLRDASTERRFDTILSPTSLVTTLRQTNPLFRSVHASAIVP